MGSEAFCLILITATQQSYAVFISPSQVFAILYAA